MILCHDFFGPLHTSLHSTPPLSLPEELIQGKRCNRKRRSIQFVVLTAKYRTIVKLTIETVSAYGKMYNSLQRKYQLLCRSKKYSQNLGINVCAALQD